MQDGSAIPDHERGASAAIHTALARCSHDERCQRCILPQGRRSIQGICLCQVGAFCRDGVFLQVVWELMVDRTSGVTVSKDQWCQAEGSVRLVALWVRGLPWYDMVTNTEYQLYWGPLV